MPQHSLLREAFDAASKLFDFSLCIHLLICSAPAHKNDVTNNDVMLCVSSKFILVS